MNSTEILPCKNQRIASALIGWSQENPRKLDDVAVEFTDRCFQSCRLCYGDFGGDTMEMPIEQINELKKEFKYAGVKTAHGTGGEILWHRQVEKIFQSFGEDGFQQEIDTNGVLIDTPMADLLARFKIETTVGIESLDPSVYKWYRGTDQLDKVIKGLELLKNKGLRPGVQTVVANFKGYSDQYDPVKNIFELVETITKMGMPVSLIQYRPMGRALENIGEIVDLTQEEKRKLMEKVNNLPKSQRQLVNGDIVFQKQIENDKVNLECAGCIGGIVRANIDVEGNVFPCNWKRDDVFGNIFSEKLGTIGEKMKRSRLEKLETLNMCQVSGCEFRRRELCYGPCLVSKIAQN